MSEPVKHDLALLAFIWKWLPPNRKDTARRRVRINRDGEWLWLASSELSVADVSYLHALAKPNYWRAEDKRRATIDRFRSKKKR
jgi:hypothetical protein